MTGLLRLACNAIVVLFEYDLASRRCARSGVHVRPTLRCCSSKMIKKI